MPKLNFNHTTTKNSKDVFSMIKKFFESDADIRRFDSNIQCQLNDQEMSGKVKGSVISADFKVTAVNTGSKLDITIDIPFIMTPLKGKVQETIQKKLDKYLA